MGSYFSASPTCPLCTPPTPRVKDAGWWPRRSWSWTTANHWSWSPKRRAMRSLAPPRRRPTTNGRVATVLVLELVLVLVLELVLVLVLVLELLLVLVLVLALALEGKPRH